MLCASATTPIARSRAPRQALRHAGQGEALSRSPSPSPSSAPPPPPPTPRPGAISAHEYNLRVGRAVEVLTSTLPEFMAVGLLDYPELRRHITHQDSDPRSRIWSLFPGFTLAEGLLAPLSRTGSRATVDAGPEDESIYHPSVQFILRAPMGTDRAVSRVVDSGDKAHHPHHPHEAGSPSLTFSGRTLYLTSAQVLRTALSGLFTRPVVVLDRIHFRRGTQSPAGRSPPPALPPSVPCMKPKVESSAPPQDELLVRLHFVGQLRLARTPHEYTVVFKYTFDENTGQILVHSVERIEPAPAKHMWLGLSGAMRMAGFGFNWGLGRPSTMCHDRPGTSLQLAPAQPLVCHPPRQSQTLQEHKNKTNKH